MNELTREMEWFLTTLKKEFRVIIEADVVAVEATELGIDEVDDFYIPSEVIAKLPETLLYEIMVTDDKEENEWIGAITFHPDSPEWSLQIITKNGQLVYRNLLPLVQ